MGSYVVLVGITKYWVEHYNKTKTPLCIAYGVGDSTGGETNYNVVAVAQSPIAENMSFEWTDVFHIAGGIQKFENGTKIRATTNPVEIKFQEKVVLKEDFILDPPVPDASLGQGTFMLENKPIASVYLYKEVKGSKNPKNAAPFYVSATGPNGPGKSKLTPKQKCILFFANKVENGTMIDDYQSEYIELDLTGKKSAQADYDDKGHWKQVNTTAADSEPEA